MISPSRCSRRRFYFSWETEIAIFSGGCAASNKSDGLNGPDVEVPFVEVILRNLCDRCWCFYAIRPLHTNERTRWPGPSSRWWKIQASAPCDLDRRCFGGGLAIFSRLTNSTRVWAIFCLGWSQARLEQLMVYY